METVTRLILKYHDGRYLSWDGDRFPLSLRLTDARRFYSFDDVSDFMKNSHYRPEVCGLDPNDFEIRGLDIGYQEVDPHE